MTATSRRGGRLLLPAVALVATIAAWWTLTTVLAVPSYYLPAPDRVAARLAGNPELYARNAAATLEKVLYGGGVGVLAGISLGTLIAFVPWTRRLVFPYVVTVRVLPKIAIAPLLLIYLGTGTGPAVVFVALIAFFPMVLSTAAGLERAPDRYRELLASVDAGPLRTVRHVYLPSALPDVFAGLKQSVTLAVVGAVVAEWTVSDSGLGYLVLIGSENLQTEMMIAALAALLVVGLGLYGAVVLVQRRLPWADADSIVDVE